MVELQYPCSRRPDGVCMGIPFCTAANTAESIRGTLRSLGVTQQQADQHARAIHRQAQPTRCAVIYPTPQVR